MSDVLEPGLNLKVTLDLSDELTWGELFRFVDLARESPLVDANSPVTYIFDDNNTDRVIWGLYAHLGLPNGAGVPRQAEARR